MEGGLRSPSHLGSEMAARPNLQVAKTSIWFYSGFHWLSVTLRMA
jgi:hypothetical protein